MGINPKDAVGALKVALELLPGAADIETARAYMDGARKYGAYNWRKHAVKMTVYIGAARRHLSLLLDGEMYSRDTGRGIVDGHEVWLVDYIQADEDNPAYFECNLTDNPTATKHLDFRVVERDVQVTRWPVLHMAHVAACMGIILDARATNSLEDDRPLPGAASRLVGQYTLTAKPTAPVDVPPTPVPDDGPSEYLMRFPEEARPYADRAYQDGFVDGRQSGVDADNEEQDKVEGLAPLSVTVDGATDVPEPPLTLDTEAREPYHGAFQPPWPAGGFDDGGGHHVRDGDCVTNNLGDPNIIWRVSDITQDGDAFIRRADGTGMQVKWGHLTKAPYPAPRTLERDPDDPMHTWYRR